MESPALRDLQRSFFAFVAGPDEASRAGGPGSLALDLVRRGGALEPDARLRVYRDMCLARLVDVLRDDYADVAGALGTVDFDRVARAYVLANPSRMPSIRHVSDRFPEFLSSACPDRPDLGERAQVDRARLEVFTEADPVPLSLERLRQVPAEEWGGLELHAIAALRMVTRAWSDQTPRPRPHAHVVRVWRQGFEIYQATVDPIEARALDRLLGGSIRLADIGEIFAESLRDEDAAREAGALLLRWLEDGILSQLVCRP